jgi:hypothetical protein
MTRRLLPAAALVALALIIAPETRAEHLTGWASAYAPGVFEDVVAYRLENRLWRNTPPSEWIYADGYIATNDCADVGRMAWLVDPAGNEHRVLIADCGGDDGGSDFMTANNIVAELDWDLWSALTTAHGKPLRVGINDRD